MSDKHNFPYDKAGIDEAVRMSDADQCEYAIVEIGDGHEGSTARIATASDLLVEFGYSFLPTIINRVGPMANWFAIVPLLNRQEYDEKYTDREFIVLGELTLYTK